MKIILMLIGFALISQFATFAHAQKAGDGARVAREAMARAMAEKERNDRIVERQRAAERAAKKARDDTKAIEDACRKARTC